MKDQLFHGCKVPFPCPTAKKWEGGEQKRLVLSLLCQKLQEVLIKRISDKQPQGGYLYLGKGEYVPAIEKYYYKMDNSGAYISIGNSKPTTTEGNLSVTTADDDALPTFVKPRGL